jgi:hypothetical protein
MRNSNYFIFDMTINYKLVAIVFFLNLYLQQVLNYGPFESGLALVPTTIMITVLMMSTKPRLMSFGIIRNLIIGLGPLAAMFRMTP